jgi:hypothetical protein
MGREDHPPQAVFGAAAAKIDRAANRGGLIQ